KPCIARARCHTGLTTLKRSYGMNIRLPCSAPYPTQQRVDRITTMNNHPNSNPAQTTVTFWGAARTVTGSMHLVEVNGFRLLLDCGLYQGKRAEARKRNSEFPFAAKEIDA